MIGVVDYRAGNAPSVLYALERLGLPARLVDGAAGIDAVDRIVLPGVGAAAATMASLSDSDLLGPLTRRVVSERVPFLGICIGMQMLYEGSEEDPEVAGLGVLPGAVRRLPEGVKHPQMQWNVLQPLKPASPLLAGLAAPCWAYFVHSYAPDASDDVVATCDYGGSVVAAVERGRLWATQFHPEKSGANGLRLLGVSAPERM